jgi:hypothetical protein
MVQLPAVNTPQFEWVLNRMPGRPRPVAPVYQPEVAARAIVHAAAHPRRREYWVGASTAAALVANAVAPGLLDRYLARTAYDGQLERRQPGEERETTGNLWTPADGPHGYDHGAHGRFDAESRDGDPQEWLSRNRNRLGAGLLAAGALGALAARRLGSGPR